MPLTQLMRKVWQARSSHVIDWNREWAMIGSKTLSCSCPASTAMDTVTSAPATEYATWETDSGMTGLTLPGMIDDPAWRAGRLISPRPACGPEASRRRALALFALLGALRSRRPDTALDRPVTH